jgi:hypothetical protein
MFKWLKQGLKLETGASVELALGWLKPCMIKTGLAGLS